MTQCKTCQHGCNVSDKHLMLCTLVLTVNLYGLCNTDETMLTQVLKQKRLYENQRGQLMNQQFNVDQTSFALQSMQDSVQTVQAMKAAGKELKAAFKQPELNINSIENLQDDLADMMVSCAKDLCISAAPC